MRTSKASIRVPRASISRPLSKGGHVTTRDYKGSAELLDQDGELVDTVQVALRYTRDPIGEQGQWGGKIHPANLSVRDWDDTTQVRLPSGKVGNCSISEHKISTTQEGWLKGSGACPF
jgi:hypothetical protein